MIPPPDLSQLTEAEKDALILALWAQVQALTARVAELEARLNEPPKTPDNSSLPPSKGHKANRPERERRAGPRQGSLGRAGGGRPLAEEPDEVVIAKAAACAHCQAALGEADQRLHARYDKIDLPPVRPVVTRVERYLGRCPCCGGTTLAPVPEGLEEGSPFGVDDRGAGDLPALHPRHQLPAADPAVPAPVRAHDQRGRLGRDVPAGQAAVRRRGRRHPRPAAPRPGRLLRRDHGAGRRPDLLELGVPERRGGDPRHPAEPRPGGGGRGAGRAPAGRSGCPTSTAPSAGTPTWQVCLAHQLRDLRYAIEAGDTVFAPRMKALLLRAVVLARRRHALKASTRREYRRRLERELDRVMALPPSHRHGQRLRKRYLAVRDSLFTFLEHPEAPPDNNGSERELRPMVVYRKVTGGFRSAWGPDLFAAVARWSAPPPGAASTPTTPSMPSYRAGPSSPPVEQLRSVSVTGPFARL